MGARQRYADIGEIYSDIGDAMRSQLVALEHDYEDVQREMARVHQTKYEQLAEFNRQLDRPQTLASLLQFKIRTMAEAISPQHASMSKEVRLAIEELYEIEKKVHLDHKTVIDTNRQTLATRQRLKESEASDKEQQRQKQQYVPIKDTATLGIPAVPIQISKPPPPPLHKILPVAGATTAPMIMDVFDELFIGGDDGQPRVTFPMPASMLNVGQTRINDTLLTMTVRAARGMGGGIDIATSAVAADTVQVVPVYFFYRADRAMITDTVRMIRDLVRSLNRQALDKRRSQIIGAIIMPLEIDRSNLAIRMPEKLPFVLSTFDRFVILNHERQLNHKVNIKADEIAKHVYSSDFGIGMTGRVSVDSRLFFTSLFQQLSSQYRTGGGLNAAVFYSKTHLILARTQPFFDVKAAYSPPRLTETIVIEDVIGLQSKHVTTSPPPQNIFQVVFDVSSTEAVVADEQGKITVGRAVQKPIKIAVILDNILAL